jgi:hypothetical protein
VDREFTPTDPLVCSLFSKPLYRPMQHRACGSTYCGECIEQAANSGSGSGSGGAAESPYKAASMRCPEADCPTPVMRARDVIPAAKALLRLLDALSIRCGSCSASLPRSACESHWLSACPQACPFASCRELLPRSELNAHIDACPCAPIGCHASEYGCEWRGERAAADAHRQSCFLSIAMPKLTQMKEQMKDDIQAEVRASLAKELASKDLELSSLRLSLSTRECQLRSYSELLSSDSGLWCVGTLVDCLDTEQSWLIAKVQRVDLIKKLYHISFVDWDQSWDEWLSFGSPRLAPAGRHTNKEHVEKHVRKAMAKEQQAGATDKACKSSGHKRKAIVVAQ